MKIKNLRWRGPARDGVIPATVVPKRWPKTTKRGWQVEIGEGYSSPVMANGRAFLHSRRDPDEIVTAIDIASGKVMWQQKYPAAFAKNQDATQMAKGPNSTPLLAGQRLFTLGVTGILTAAEQWQPSQLWRNADVTMYTVSPVFADGVIYGMSNPGAGSVGRGETALELRLARGILSRDAYRGGSGAGAGGSRH